MLKATRDANTELQEANNAVAGGAANLDASNLENGLVDADDNTAPETEGKTWGQWARENKWKLIAGGVVLTAVVVGGIVLVVKCGSIAAAYESLHTGVTTAYANICARGAGFVERVRVFITRGDLVAANTEIANLRGQLVAAQTAAEQAGRVPGLVDDVARLGDEITKLSANLTDAQSALAAEQAARRLVEEAAPTFGGYVAPGDFGGLVQNTADGFRGFFGKWIS